MRLTTIIMLIGLLRVSASTQGQTVTLTGREIPLKKVFSAVRQQTGYGIFFNDNAITGTKPVTVSVQRMPLKEFMALVLKDQPLDFLMEDKTIILSRKPAGAHPTDKDAADIPKVDGLVLDAGGKPLPGVSVMVLGTSMGTATNSSGAFSLSNVPADATLVFSSIGFKKETVSLSGTGPNDARMVKNADGTLSLRVTLDDDVSILQGTTIVNTGYQSISLERSAGSFSKPNINIMANRSTSMSVLQRLEGLVPGLMINGAPGTENVLLRGLSSINAARAPLYVVDGIPTNDISSINPQDIADITVLKDATAASVWGAKASNGVVVIVTKKGGNNEKIKVNYDGFMNFQGKPDMGYHPVLDSRQYIQAYREIFDPVTNPWSTVTAYPGIGVSGVPPHEVILYNQYRGIITEAQANNSLDSLGAINNISQIKDLWYRNASLMNHTVSVNGGGRLYSFYGSLAFTNAKSNRPGDGNRTYKVNLRQDLTINKWLQFYLITDITNTRSSSGRNVSIDGRFYPYQLFKDGNGNNLSVPYMGYLSDSTRLAYQSRSRINLDYNPLNEVGFGYTNSDAMLNRIIGGTKIKLLPGLRFEGVYSYIKGNNRTTSFDSDKSYLTRSEVVQFTVAATPASNPVYTLPTTGGKYAVSNLTQQSWTIRNQLVYDNQWNNRTHQLVALAGQEAQDQHAMATSSTVRGYNELLQTFAALDYATLSTSGVSNPVMANNFGRSILPNDVFTKSEDQNRFTSFYANGAYTYDQKYSINGSWRIDKSNLFGIDKSAQNRPVWSVGAKWALGNENFMNRTNWINRLDLRATYGITGNSPLPGTASSYDILRSRSSNFFPGNAGLYVVTPGNTRLTWESTKYINLGVDFSVLDNRLSGSVDVYSKKTEDLIGLLPVNPFTGYASITGNFGDLSNKGVEVMLTSENIISKNFSWQTIFTTAYNKNEISRLNSFTPISTGEGKVQQRFLNGYSAFAVFAYQFAGLDNMGDPTIYLADKQVTKARRVAKLEDIVYAGTYQPIWSGGLSNIFSYRDLSLGVNIIYNLGHVMRRDVNTFYQGRNNPFSFTFTGGNFHKEFADRWKNPGDEANTNVPSYVSTTAANNRRDVSYYTLGDLNVISASYMKLRDITLGYSLPRQLIQRLRTENISLRLQVSNIMLWKANEYGIDPEFQSAFTGTRTLRTNQGTVTIGAHVTF